MQVARVEAFGEPGVERGEEGAGGGTLALALPRAARGSSRRAARTTSRPARARCRGRGGRAASASASDAAGVEEEVAVEPMQLGIVEGLARLRGDARAPSRPCRAPRRAAPRPGAPRRGARRQPVRPTWVPVSPASARPSSISTSAASSPSATRAAALTRAAKPSHSGKPCASLSAITSAARSRCAPTSPRSHGRRSPKTSAYARLNG